MRKLKTQLEPTKKVIGYTRVSSPGQVKDGESLERQAFEIRAYCQAKGLPEPEIICDEGVSGFKSNRDGFQQLIALCDSRQVRTVIVYDVSRFSRSTRKTLEVLEDTLDKNGIEFLSVHAHIDRTTPVGKASFMMQATFNQLYRDEISYKTKEALKHKSAKKEKTGGVIPFGYELIDGVRLAPLPGEVETVKLIHSLRGQGCSLREIVAFLSQRGIRTKTGKSSWNPKVVRGILNRTADLVCQDPDLTDDEKDALLHDVQGAVYRI